MNTLDQMIRDYLDEWDNPEPTAWPCPVWSFISDRMETP